MARHMPFLTAVMACRACMAASPAQSRVDALGDPLPEGAIARLGTTRMRHFSTQDHYCWGIRSIAWSPDGKMIATTSYADEIGIEARLWEASTGRPLSLLENNLRYVPSFVRFAPDSKTIAAAARDKVVLWDTATGKELAQLEGHQSDVDSLQFQDGGKTIVSVSRDGVVHWWDIAGRKVVRQWSILADDPKKTEKGKPILRRGIRHSCFSADGKTLALNKWWVTRPDTMYSENLAIVFDLSAQKELWRQDIQVYDCEFAFTPDGKRLAESWAASFLLRETATGRRLTDLQDVCASGMDFSPEGKTLALRTSGGIAFWSDDKTPVREFPVPRHNGLTKSPAYSPDGKRVAVESKRTFQILDVGTGKPAVSWPSYDEGFRNLTFSADGRSLFADDLSIDTATWRPRAASDEPPWQKFVLLQAVSRNRALWIATDYNHEDVLLEMKTGRLLTRLKAPVEGIVHHGGFFSPRASLYVMQDFSCDGTETDTLFAIPSGKRLWQFSCNKSSETSCWSFSADESRVAFLEHSTATIHFRDTATGKLLGQFGKYEGSTTLALSPNGKFLAVRAHDRRNVRILDLPTGKPRQALVLDQDAKPDDNACLLWSADNRLLAVGGLDNSVRLWEVESAQVWREFRGHLARATCLAFSPDGKILASASEDTTLLIWKTVPDK